MLKLKSDDEIDFEMSEPIAAFDVPDSMVNLEAFHFFPKRKPIVLMDESMDRNTFISMLLENHPNLSCIPDLHVMDDLRMKVMDVMKRGIFLFEERVRQSKLRVRYEQTERATYMLKLIAEEKMEIFIRDLVAKVHVKEAKQIVQKQRAKNVHRSPDVNKVLMDWLMYHLKKPYPTPQEKQQLADATKLTVQEVTTWMGNKRNRELKKHVTLKKSNKTR
jgi:hypothetical protein